MDMNEFFEMPFKGPPGRIGSEAVLSANTTKAYIISPDYMYAIIAVYAIILTIVFFAIAVVAIRRLRNSLCASPGRSREGYTSLPRQSVIGINGGEFGPFVDTRDENDAMGDQNSDYDNISLEPASTYYDAAGSSPFDTPPEYEHPPSYSLSTELA